ncbi:MAG: OsmC family protein [Polyangiales bacterium]
MEINVSFPGGKRIGAQVGAFEVMTDQPPAFGGEASAIAPYDLFLASVATCSGIYALGFCDARGISTEGLAMRLQVDLDPGNGLARAMRVDLTPPKNFPDHYRAALVRAVEHCKVKKSLVANPPVSVVLVDEAEHKEA